MKRLISCEIVLIRDKANTEHFLRWVVPWFLRASLMWLQKDWPVCCVFSQDDVKLPFTSGWQFWCCFVTVKCPTRHVPALEQSRPIIIIIIIIIICPAAQSRGRKKKYGKVLNSVCFSCSVHCVEGGDRIPRCSYGQALKQETIPRHPRWWLWCVCQSPVPAEWPRHSTCLLSLWKRGRRRVCHSQLGVLGDLVSCRLMSSEEIMPSSVVFCLFASWITQKLLNRCSQNLVERWQMGHGRTH